MRFLEHLPISYLKLKLFKTATMKVPDFDVLSEEPETAARILKERLQDNDIKILKLQRNLVLVKL